MKSYIYYFAFFLIALVLISCSTTSESEKPLNAAVVSEEVKLQMEAWNQLSPIAQKILGSFKGVIREKYWGQELNSINELVEKSENQPSNGVSFTQYLDDTDLNFVDISYLGKEGKLTEIRFDIFLENAEEVKSLQNELTAFLKVKNTKSNEKTRIVLEDVSTSKDPGLQLVFSQKP